MSPVGQVWRDGSVLLLVVGPGDIAGSWGAVVLDVSVAPASRLREGERVSVPARCFFGSDPDFVRVQ